jgi:predicted nucleotidyltransferase component of viral defense system
LTQNKLKNVPASVRQRLLTLAKDRNRSFEEVVRLYAMERFLYRIGVSKYSKKLILKGALLLRVWKETIHRPTMDIDALGFIKNDPQIIETCIRELCSEPVVPDGLVFDPESVKSEEITTDAEYKGRRIRFLGHLERMRIPMQVDIGVGDVVFPSPLKVEFPSMLGFPSPVVLGYTRESSIAEKFHAMVRMGELNSRMKDYYDIWELAKSFDFEGTILAKAFAQTFEKRQTSFEKEIPALSSEFASQKQVQWLAFRKKLTPIEIPSSFVEVVIYIREFLMPIHQAIMPKSSPPDIWIAPGPWKNR